MRIVLAFAVLAGISAVATSVLAQAPPAPRTARLVYSQATASCPDEEAMKNIVAVRLGYDPFKADADRIITAEIRREGGVLVGHVEMRDAFKALGSRTLSSDKGDCVELGSAMALAISIAIDPMSLMRPSPEAPGGAHVEAPAPTPVAPAPPLPPSPADTSPPRSAVVPSPVAVRLRVGATIRASFGSTPGVSFAPGLMVGVSHGVVSIDVEGRGHVATSADVAPHGSVDASLLMASLVPCYRVRFAVGCALLGVGRLSGRGHGVDAPESESATYAEAGARVGLELPLNDVLSVRVGVDLLVPLVATTLRLRNADVWSNAIVGGAAGAGLVGEFP